VREREKKKESEGVVHKAKANSTNLRLIKNPWRERVCERERERVCVCERESMCVRERERERAKKKRVREREREKKKESEGVGQRKRKREGGKEGGRDEIDIDLHER